MEADEDVEAFHFRCRIVITSKHVREETVRDFINVCQGEEVQLNNNAQEFLELAIEWYVEAVYRFVRLYITDNAIDMIIPTILRRY